MPKTNFVNRDLEANEPGTTVTAEFLNKLNKHRHIGAPRDADGGLNFCVDSSAVDHSVVLDFNPPLDGFLQDGTILWFRAARTNIGYIDMQIKILYDDGIAAFFQIALLRNGYQALVAGDIVAGKQYGIMCSMIPSEHMAIISPLG